ncbi:succinyl-diaminopimelate desuccinylase [Pseudactinotalea terrae]|uniref:succinyl-diaminopimelate desuccinylase n=1 Tax=Pseudactinotalea terrae TaxID=1743262 RepID=UPI0012E0D08B|nr:succinyl-diaminopimelate desuccinylase [Pseudactinotalea terrae]
MNRLPDLATTDVVSLTQAVCDIESVSGTEAALADAVQAALGACPHLEVLRDGDAVIARTHAGRAHRVVVAGHLDTVPIRDNLPVRRQAGAEGEELWGRGTVDMKGGVAVALHLAARLAEPAKDITWIFYDNEEVDGDLNGLGRVARTHPDWLEADFAVLGEPSNGNIEGGCNGTLRAEVRLVGKAAHSARAWMGRNAIHDAADVLARLVAYRPAEIDVEGLRYREGLNAVGITGGVAGNMIPPEATITVNYRFAPDKTPEQAFEHVREVLPGYDLVLTDAAPGARPGLDHPVAQDFVAAVGAVTGGAPSPKYGWTDVARFSALGIPAVNFGPGDPNLAHADDERVPVAQIESAAAALEAWLSGHTTTEERTR